MNNDLLTPKEVAKRLGVHVKTFQQWCLDGEGPTPTLVGARQRYARADVEAWLRSRRGRDAA